MAHRPLLAGARGPARGAARRAPQPRVRRLPVPAGPLLAATPWLVPVPALLDAQTTWTLILALIVGLGSLGVAELRARDRKLLEPPPHDVLAVRLGLDARVRPFLERQLATRPPQARSPGEALAARLAHACGLLRELRLAWTHVAAHDHAMASPGTADATVARHLDVAAAPLPPPAPGGAGCVLVTLVVEAHGELAPTSPGDDPEQLRRVLEVLPALPATLLRRVEVVVAPASGAGGPALELALPQLRRLPDPRPALAVCHRCFGPYPAPLVACPRCLAPAMVLGGRA